MKRLVRIRDPKEDETIPDALNGKFYSIKELKGAVIVHTCDDPTKDDYYVNNIGVMLADGRTATLQSIDLEFEPFNEEGDKNG